MGKRSTKVKDISKVVFHWYQELWLPVAAAVYLFICMFDFVAMPIYTAIHNSNIENKIVAIAQNQPSTNITEFIAKEDQATKQWNPLTLLGGGLFHLAYGAILGSGAITGGFAKKSAVEGFYKNGSSDHDDTTPTK